MFSGILQHIAQPRVPLILLSILLSDCSLETGIGQA